MAKIKDNHQSVNIVEKVLMDLVCGMELEEESEFIVVYKGKEYHFCSQHCKEHFEADPEKYVGE